MTLIELLAGLVILGTVLAAMVVARGRMTRQWAEADRRIEAGKALDAMLATWADMPARSLPVPASGPLEGVKNCTWRSHWISNTAAAKLSARVVRVEVFDQTTRSEPILSVEMVVHVDPPRPATTRAGGVR